MTRTDRVHFDAYVARLVAEAPPLSAEQADRLATLLRPPRRRAETPNEVS